MTAPLNGVSVVEVSSFVAAPSAGLVLCQLGADVTRVDPRGGAADVRRWPLSSEGRSIYWAGLQRGKRSVEVDLATAEGRTTLRRLVCDGGGILVSNLYGKPWLSDEALRADRPDLIHVQVLGRADGSPAVDYVVNAATGLPNVTGPEQLAEPVNHVLPAWDLLCGMYAAVAVLAAVHRRRETGAGSHVTVSLEDVATSTLTTLGLLSEAHQLGRSRERIGNAVYGTFGMDAALRDGTVVMVATVTDRQWAELVAVTGRSAAVEAIEATLPADFSDEGARYRHRAVLVGLLRPWFAQRTLAEVTAALEQTHILWSPFRELVDLAADVAAGRSDVARLVDEPGLGEHLATSGPLRFRGEAAPDIPATPSLGEHGLQA